MHKTKEQRREEAQARQTARDLRSASDQLAILFNLRPGNANRETSRLLVGLTSRKRDFVLAAAKGA